MKLAGQRGYQPFAHCLVAGNVVADQWTTYAAAVLLVSQRFPIPFIGSHRPELREHPTSTPNFTQPAMLHKGRVDGLAASIDDEEQMP